MLTGLLIIETKANDISAYIPTNVISITDGQIFLETDLFNAGVHSHVPWAARSIAGGNAQIKAMKSVAGNLRLNLSQYRDLEAFAAFASPDLDAASRAQLDRGARLVELLKQPQYSPFPVEEQVVSIWAGGNGYLDDVPVEDVSRFETDFLDYLRRSHAGILQTIRESLALAEDTVTALKDAIEEFRKGFETSSGELLTAEDEQSEPLENEDQETIARRVPEAREGVVAAHGSAASPRPAADFLGAVHRQDHPRAGADRVVADRQGAAADALGRAVRPRAHPRGGGSDQPLDQRHPPVHPGA